MDDITDAQQIVDGLIAQQPLEERVAAWHDSVEARLKDLDRQYEHLSKLAVEDHDRRLEASRAEDRLMWLEKRIDMAEETTTGDLRDLDERIEALEDASSSVDSFPDAGAKEGNDNA